VREINLILRSRAQRGVSKDGPQDVRVAHLSAEVTPRDETHRFAVLLRVRCRVVVTKRNK
jgi:hypothetical protein